RRRGDGRVTLGDEALLPVQPLNLPGAEREQDKKGGAREERGPDDPSGGREGGGHHRRHGAASRPKARWRYCSAMRPALKRRSMATLPTRTKGVHSKR